MGQSEGKQLPIQPASEAGASPPVSPTTTENSHNVTTTNDGVTSDTPGEEQQESEHVVARKSNAEVLKQSTEELKEGLTKLGSNLMAKAKVPYTSYSVSPGPAIKKAALAVEDAIVTVREGITKTEEEPELLSLGSINLFLPIIKSSVPIADVARHVQQRTTIEYLDPKIVVSVFKDYQRYAVLTAKMVAQRQTELMNKVRDTEMSSGRKAVFTLAMNVTDMRHFSTQFNEVGRFHANLERTKQTIKDVLVMFEKLNAALPTEEQLEPLQIPANLTASSSRSSYTSFSSLFPIHALPYSTPTSLLLSTHRPFPPTSTSNPHSPPSVPPTDAPLATQAPISTPSTSESSAPSISQPQLLPTDAPPATSDAPTPSESSEIPSQPSDHPAEAPQSPDLNTEDSVGNQSL